MKKLFTLSLMVTIAALLAFAFVVEAQPRPDRVGVVVRISTPDDFFMTRAEIASDILRTVRSTIDDVRGITLVDQDVLASAQDQLDISLDIDSENRELNVVSNLLNLDRLVVIDIEITSRFNVDMTAVVYNNNVERKATISANATGIPFGSVLERATGALLEDLIPLLS